MSDCPRSELIVDLMEDFLEGDALREAEAHVSGCAVCSEARDEYRQLMGDLQGLPAPAPSAEARDAAHAAVLAAMSAAPAPADVAPLNAPAQAAPASEAPRAGRMIPWPLLAAAACLLLALPLAQFLPRSEPNDMAASVMGDEAEAGDQAPPADYAAAQAPAAEALEAESFKSQRTEEAEEAGLRQDLDRLAKRPLAKVASDPPQSPALKEADPAEGPPIRDAMADEGAPAANAVRDAAGNKPRSDSPTESDGITPGTTPEAEKLRRSMGGMSQPTPEDASPEAQTEAKAKDDAKRSEDGSADFGDGLADADKPPADADDEEGEDDALLREARELEAQPAHRKAVATLAAGLQWEVERGQAVAHYAWSEDGNRLFRVSGVGGRTQAPAADPAADETPAGEEQPEPARDPAPAPPKDAGKGPAQEQQQLTRVVRRLEADGRKNERARALGATAPLSLKPLSARELSLDEAEDLKAILSFELTQPDEGKWGERVRTVLSLLVGFDVPKQERKSLERLARRRLRARLDEPAESMDMELEPKDAQAR